MAFGIMATGSSLGGAIIPITASNLIDIIGYGSRMYVNLTSLTGFLQVQMDYACYCSH